nr:putative ORF1 [Marmot picobirnavirus]AVX53697.1 putative ORF1 [Marmot picobirnavirus]AVX53803.1 putative ORF1 [Marmot picobirnavirus]
MTQNQIAFYKARNEKEHYERQDQESYRSNSAREAETHEHNVESRRLGWAGHAETERSNRAREYETQRSNRANEAEKAANRLMNLEYQYYSANQLDARERLKHEQLLRQAQSELKERERSNRRNEELLSDKNFYDLRTKSAQNEISYYRYMLDKAINEHGQGTDAWLKEWGQNNWKGLWNVLGGAVRGF